VGRHAFGVAVLNSGSFNTGGDMLNNFKRPLLVAMVAAATTAGVSGAALAQGAAQAAAKSAVVGSAEAGSKKTSMCIGCHGIAEYKTAFPSVYRVPKIAGQSEKYLEVALQAYRSGERNHPSMVGIAKALSDQDIADLAAYYAKKK
jgi:cytochrome c553